LGRTVSLDLDDKTGKDIYGRWVAICYRDGKNFNKQLVDTGHGIVKDFKNNEFDPKSWWTA
jgi:endonuclease YncB( thermonuclease family)